MNEKSPYLAGIQAGDKLYNFLEGNKEYRVIEVHKDADYPIVIQSNDETRLITWFGTRVWKEKIPYYLYQPVEVLDPEDLPPRPWRPQKGEWIWVKDKRDKHWNLRPFIRIDGEGYYICDSADCLGDTASWEEAVPFRGELPPGLIY